MLLIGWTILFSTVWFQNRLSIHLKFLNLHSLYNIFLTLHCNKVLAQCVFSVNNILQYAECLVKICSYRFKLFRNKTIQTKLRFIFKERPIFFGLLWLWPNNGCAENLSTFYQNGIMNSYNIHHRSDKDPNVGML